MTNNRPPTQPEMQDAMNGTKTADSVNTEQSNDKSKCKGISADFLF